MPDTLIALLISGFLLILFLAMRSEQAKFRKINERIKREARNKNLIPLKIDYPAFSQWSHNPFGNTIHVGHFPFFGISSTKKSYRILKAKNTKGDNETWWIKAEGIQNLNKMVLEWKSG